MSEKSGKSELRAIRFFGEVPSDTRDEISTGTILVTKRTDVYSTPISEIEVKKGDDLRDVVHTTTISAGGKDWVSTTRERNGFNSNYRPNPASRVRTSAVKPSRSLSTVIETTQSTSDIIADLLKETIGSKEFKEQFEILKGPKEIADKVEAEPKLVVAHTSSDAPALKEEILRRSEVELRILPSTPSVDIPVDTMPTYDEQTAPEAIAVADAIPAEGAMLEYAKELFTTIATNLQQLDIETHGIVINSLVVEYCKQRINELGAGDDWKEAFNAVFMDACNEVYGQEFGLGKGKSRADSRSASSPCATGPSSVFNSTAGPCSITTAPSPASPINPDISVSVSVSDKATGNDFFEPMKLPMPTQPNIPGFQEYFDKLDATFARLQTKINQDHANWVLAVDMAKQLNLESRAGPLMDLMRAQAGIMREDINFADAGVGSSAGGAASASGSAGASGIKFGGGGRVVADNVVVKETEKVEFGGGKELSEQEMHDLQASVAHSAASGEEGKGKKSKKGKAKKKY